ncbi:hypothetical protein [Actinacidiphila oryziradicis]|uniref:Uncharacterized protein n=1 Tax=Actinacidiphila oryziradicis TaxID=2571141 RepID=A0A4V5MW71_9ACTN|nr:hypothetical protein [Actinacidiphila oryziradicis]TJZ94748.1 hypothetical protein FCI23_53070 [Actinacidiphila oryziradicis]
MPYEIDLTDEVADDYQQMPAWAQRSFEMALDDAADDPHLLPTFLPSLPSSRVLEFAGGRGSCMVEIAEEDKRLIVRYLNPPR